LSECGVECAVCGCGVGVEERSVGIIRSILDYSSRHHSEYFSSHAKASVVMTSYCQEHHDNTLSLVQIMPQGHLKVF
jgi:hypothetical protein